MVFGYGLELLDGEGRMLLNLDLYYKDLFYDLDPHSEATDTKLESGINLMSEMYERFMRVDGSQYDLVYTGEFKYRIELGYWDRKAMV